MDPRAIEKPKMMKAKGMRVKGQAVVVEPEMLWALESIFPALAAKRDRRVAAVRGAHTLWSGHGRFIHLQRSVLVELQQEMVVARCERGKTSDEDGVRDAFTWTFPRRGITGVDFVIGV